MWTASKYDGKVAPVRTRLVNKAQRVWTVDDPLKMKQLMRERYVTGIITNRFEEAMDMRDLVAKEAKAPV